MAGYPNIPNNGQFLPSPTSGYAPRTPPPQRGNIPPAVSLIFQELILRNLRKKCRNFQGISF